MTKKVETVEKFEVALERLEKIVEQLEEGELPLDESLALFEEGIKLTRICGKRLDEAEKKIQMLIKDEKGLKLEDFDPDET